jgi:hypothetical protein
MASKKVLIRRPPITTYSRNQRPKKIQQRFKTVTATQVSEPFNDNNFDDTTELMHNTWATDNDSSGNSSDSSDYKDYSSSSSSGSMDKGVSQPIVHKATGICRTRFNRPARLRKQAEKDVNQRKHWCGVMEAIRLLQIENTYAHAELCQHPGCYSPAIWSCYNCNIGNSSPFIRVR